MLRHFLTGEELDAAELEQLLRRAAELKSSPLSSDRLRRRTIALIFQAASTRTRVSFEQAIHELGGHTIALGAEVGLNKRESVRDVMMSASGVLDLEMFGPAVFPHVQEEILASMQWGLWKDQADGPKVWRRSVYVYRKRNLNVPMLANKAP